MIKRSNLVREMISQTILMIKDLKDFEERLRESDDDISLMSEYETGLYSRVIDDFVRLKNTIEKSQNKPGV